MKIIKPSIEFIWMTNAPLQTIERIGRTCYKSEDKISESSYLKFVKMLVDRGHEAMIEHAIACYKVICDRGVTHEIVRHRIASYAQESTRYCNYNNDQFGNEITVIEPSFFVGDMYSTWKKSMEEAENKYLELIKRGATPQEARTVLPNSLKTEIVVTMNFREWRHFFKLRTASTAHPQMQEVAKLLFHDLRNKVPIIFDDITWK